MYAQIIRGCADQANVTRLFQLIEQWHTKHAADTDGFHELQFFESTSNDDIFEIRLMFSSMHTLDAFTSSPSAMEYLSQSRQFVIGEFDFSAGEIRVL